MCEGFEQLLVSVLNSKLEIELSTFTLIRFHVLRKQESWTPDDICPFTIHDWHLSWSPIMEHRTNISST